MYSCCFKSVQHYPPLPGPMFTQNPEISQTKPQGRSALHLAYSSALASPKSQRQSRSRDPGFSGRGADPIATYAQAVRSPAPSHTEGPAMQAFSPSQALALSDPWDPLLRPSVQAQNVYTLRP